MKALAFIIVQQAVFSLYLGCSFAPSHKGMPVIESDPGLSFARRQVTTARQRPRSKSATSRARTSLARSYNQKLWILDLTKGATYPPS